MRNELCRRLSRLNDCTGPHHERGRQEQQRPDALRRSCGQQSHPRRRADSNADNKEEQAALGLQLLGTRR